jgi:hypothetical protein
MMSDRKRHLVERWLDLPTTICLGAFRLVDWEKATIKKMVDRAISLQGIYQYRFGFRWIGLFGVYIGVLDTRLIPPRRQETKFITTPRPAIDE